MKIHSTPIIIRNPRRRERTARRHQLHQLRDDLFFGGFLLTLVATACLASL